MLLDTKIGEDIGGEAPSVEAKIRKLTIAVTGGTPTATMAEYATGPRLTVVEVAFRGPCHQGDDEADDQDH